MTIKRKLSLVVLLFTAIVLLLMNTFYYLNIARDLIDSNKNEIAQTLEMQSVALTNFFHSREVEVNYLAKSKLVHDAFTHYYAENLNGDLNYQYDYHALNAFFTALIVKNINLRDAFILSPEGRIMASSHPQSLWIDLSDRQYFIDAMDGKTTISNLLVDRVEEESVLFVAAPVYSENGDDEMGTRAIGVIANIIDGVRASEMLRALTDISLGKAYLIDTSGMIIFHTEKDLIGTHHLEPSIDAYFMHTQHAFDSKLFEDTSDKLYVAYHAVENTPWRLVIEQEQRIILSSAYHALRMMIIITLIVLAIAAVMISKFSEIITAPIISLSEIMRQNIIGDLGLRSQHKSDDEIGQLASDFNHMLDELTGAYEEVETQNEELLATEEELRQNYENLFNQKKELTEIQDKFKLALDGSSAVVWEWDLEDSSFYASDLWHKVTGEASHVPKIEHVVFETLIDLYEQERLMTQFYQNWKKHMETISFDIRLEEKTFHVKAMTIYDVEGKPLKVSGTLIDITKERQLNMKVHQLAFTNMLTGFSNRTAYITDITQLIMENEVESFSIFQFDIDHFARVNDSLGHIIGDHLLILVAERIKTLISSTLKVYHLSADEYAVIGLAASTLDEIALIIKCIYALFEVPFEIEGRFFHISASMGVTRYPCDGNTVEKLVQNADTAMYAAKKTNRSSYVYYESVMSENATQKIEIEDLLRTAISEERVFMVYQPQFNLETQSFVSAEALMRLKDFDGNVISPLLFIPIAEETGLIIELGYWAFRNVCETFKSWQAMGITFENVSVNVSVVQLKQPNFANELLSILEETGVPAHYIELEITESILLEIDAGSENIIETLRDYGFKVALDDFGTGYSSLSYLRQLPIKTLKIDKSFINNLYDSKKDRELVRQVIGLARELGLRVIAEGVETEEQYVLLAQYQCDVIQGYYFSKPITTHQIIDLITPSI